MAAAVTLLLVPALGFSMLSPTPVVLASAVYGWLMLWVYVEARRGRYRIKLTYLLTLLVIAAAWFPASGSAGSALLYHGSAVIYGMVVLRGRARVTALLALVGVAVALLGLEYYVPSLVQPFPNPAMRAIQLTTGVVAATLLSSLVLGGAVAAYDRERQRLGASIAAVHASQGALAESQATLSALVNSTRDQVWLLDPEHLHVTQFNEAFAAACHDRMGVAPTVGQALTTLFPPAEAHEWTAHCRRALERGAFTIEHTDGRDRTVLASLSPVVHAGRTLGVSVFCHDITERRAQERSRAEMERRLLQAQKMESLGRLAGGVAHDYNNMLAAILGYAELLRDGEGDPDRLSYVTAIERAAERSGDLTRKLLAFGRRGKNVIESVNLNVIVRDCLVLLTPALRANVRLQPELAATATIDGDPSQISQLVLNLCLNANEAMPDGGPLDVITRDVPADGSDAAGRRWVELIVRDSGIGMSEELKSRIFEPFFTTKPGGAASGTGLGLATVDGVVHLHGGTIGVDSSPEHGSTFTVRLPRGTLEATVAATLPRQASGHGTILVIDDEPLVRQVISTSLQSLGYSPLAAADGVEGLALFEREHDKLSGVILDLKMPRLSGRETFFAMRQRDATVPVLLCSGYGDNEEAEELRRAGARGLVRKPFTRQLLAEALSTMQSIGPAPA